jgi:hypothetical protein
MTASQPFDRAAFIATASMHGIVVVHQIHPTFHGHVRACDTEQPYTEADGKAAKVLCPDCHDVVARSIRDRDKVCEMFDVPRELVPLRGVDPDDLERWPIPVPLPTARRILAARSWWIFRRAR